jgi:hypothetical protein
MKACILTLFAVLSYYNVYSQIEIPNGNFELWNPMVNTKYRQAGQPIKLPGLEDCQKILMQ